MLPVDFILLSVVSKQKRYMTQCNGLQLNWDLFMGIFTKKTEFLKWQEESNYSLYFKLFLFEWRIYENIEIAYDGYNATVRVTKGGIEKFCLTTCSV